MVIFFCAILVTHKLVYTSFSKKKKKKSCYTHKSHCNYHWFLIKKKFMFWVEDLHEFGLD